MNKKLLMNLLVSLIILTSLVTASLYAEKIPDSNRFTSIEPKWSAKLEFLDGTEIKVSLIEFIWLSPQGNKEKTDMMYLNDGENEYIADKGSWGYAKTSKLLCDSGYENCIDLCGGESCIDECVIDYNCKTEYICENLGPDGSCGVNKATATFGKNNLRLGFDPKTGQLKYNGLTFYKEQAIKEIIVESGFLSEEVLSLG